MLHSKPHFYSTGNDCWYLAFVLANAKVFVKDFKANIDVIYAAPVATKFPM